MNEFFCVLISVMQALKTVVSRIRIEYFKNLNKKLNGMYVKYVDIRENVH